MLRLEIDGLWEPEDFIQVLKATESLYYKTISKRWLTHDFSYHSPEQWGFLLSFEESLDRVNDWVLARTRIIVSSHARLRVGRIEYGSPGGIDLVGLGEASKAIGGILDRLINFFTERHLRAQRDKQAAIETRRKEVELKKDEETLRSLKLENAHKLLSLYREFQDVPEDLFLSLVGRDQDNLIPAIVERKLIGVRTTDGEPPESDKAA